MQIVQASRTMIEHSNVRMILDENVLSQEAKNNCGMKTENYDSMADRVEKLESSLKYVLRKVDQLDKKY